MYKYFCKTKIVILIIIGFILVFIAIIFFYKLAKPDSNYKISSQVKFVKTFVLHESFIPKEISVYGVAKSLQKVDVINEVPGKILRVYVSLSELVHKNQLLIELDHSSILAKLQEENAKLSYQKSNYNRFLFLLTKRIVSKDHVELLESQLQQTIARVNQLNIEKNKYIIRAPISGLVGLNNLFPGKYLLQSQKLLSIKNINKLYVDFALPATQVSKLQIGLPVILKSVDQAEISGKIIAFDNGVDTSLDSLFIRVAINNVDSLLRDGSYLMGEIILPIKQRVFFIPETALVKNFENSSVWVVKKNKVYLRQVVIFRENNMVFVKNGLKPGEKIVLSRVDELVDGEKIGELQ